MTKRDTIRNWVETASSGIRFKPDREKAARELRDHLEDKRDVLMRARGLTAEEAEREAVACMGDAEEVKRELARVHRPWLGCLWRFSQAVLVLVLAVSALRWGGRGAEWVQQRWQDGRQEPGYGEYLRECYHQGVDPFGPDSPWQDEDNVSDVIRTPLRVWKPGGTARAGNYRFSVQRAALWSFQEGVGPEEDWWLFCTLRADSLPWEALSLDAAWRIRAVDSFGNRYYSSFQVYELGEDRGEAGYVMANPGEGGLFHETFDLNIIDIVPGAEWIRLEFDRGGPAWSLTIPLAEETL